MRKVATFIRPLFGGILVLLSTLLNGCANVPVKSTAEGDFTQIMPLQPVPNALQNHVWLEKFTFTLTDKHAQLANTFAKKSMLLQTELSATGINLAAMSFSGALLAQASWLSGAQVVTSEIGLAKGFNAKQVLHDLQLANWPLADIEQNLLTGFTVSEHLVSESKTDDLQIVYSRIRRFIYHGEVFIIIRYTIPTSEQQNQTIHFEQVSQGYQLIIERLADNALVVED